MTHDAAYCQHWSDILEVIVCSIDWLKNFIESKMYKSTGDRLEKDVLFAHDEKTCEHKEKVKTMMRWICTNEWVDGAMKKKHLTGKHYQSASQTENKSTNHSINESMNSWIRRVTP